MRAPEPPPVTRWPERLVLLAALALVSFQLFVPPVTGLGDNGDFGWVMSVARMRHAPAPAGEAPSWHLRRGYETGALAWPDFPSTAHLLVLAALGLDRAVTGDTRFDITTQGLVHTAAFALALGLLLSALRASGLGWGPRLLLGALLAVALCDVAHVAYFNSLYTAPALFLCLLLATGCLALGAARGRLGAALLLGAWASALLFAWSKPQVAPLGLVWALVLWRARPLVEGRALRRLVPWLSGALCAASLAAVAFVTTQPLVRDRIQRINLYHAVFKGALVLSPDVGRAAGQLGVPPELALYTGQRAYGFGAPDLTSRAWQEGFFERVGFGRLARFYAANPSVLGALLWHTGRAALFYPALEMPRHERAREFSPPWELRVWGTLLARALPDHVLTLVALLALLAWGAARARARAASAGARLLAELYLALLAMAAFQLAVVPVVSGLMDLPRHLYAFHVPFDLCLAVGSGLAVHRAWGWATRRVQAGARNGRAGARLRPGLRPPSASP